MTISRQFFISTKIPSVREMAILSCVFTPIFIAIGFWERNWRLPALYLIAVLGLLAYRGYIQRQNVKPFAELAGDELLVGNRMVAPTAVDRVPVKSLASLRIVGPSTGRYIRCCFADGAARDIGPYLMQSALEARLVDWLGRELPRTISVVAQEPAGFFEKTRASY